MSEKYAGSYLHYSIDTQTYLLQKTSRAQNKILFAIAYLPTLLPPTQLFFLLFQN